MSRSTYLGVLAVACFALAAPAVARADVVSDWNAIAQAETLPLRPSAHGESRGIAMVEGAVYDAVNAIDRGHQPYLVDLDEVGAQPWASQDAAAATAAHHVLLAITPLDRHLGLDLSYAATLAGIYGGPARDEGVRVGEEAAEAMIAARAGDGFMAAFDFSLVIGPDAGDWRPLTPAALDPDPWVGSLKPFLIESPSQFRSKGPNDLTSRAYEKDFAEVKEVGALNSATRTADQTAAAVFWQFAPIALWNPLARDLAARYDLDTADQARLYAMVNLAAADGAIACWNDKYSWHFWRPRAAVREADTDDNPATIADPSWEPLFSAATQTIPPLTTPAFPDHPSGHGCLSAAVLNTMADFFGMDKIPITIVSGRTLDGVPIPPRQFDRFSDVLDEIVDARVWGGIHFRTADEQGATIGKDVAHWLHKNYFRKLH
jgi:hypothetical protein